MIHKCKICGRHIVPGAPETKCWICLNRDLKPEDAPIRAAERKIEREKIKKREKEIKLREAEERKIELKKAEKEIAEKQKQDKENLKAAEIKKKNLAIRRKIAKAEEIIKRDEANKREEIERLARLEEQKRRRQETNKREEIERLARLEEQKRIEAKRKEIKRQEAAEREKKRKQVKIKAEIAHKKFKESGNWKKFTLEPGEEEELALKLFNEKELNSERLLEYLETRVDLRKGMAKHELPRLLGLSLRECKIILQKLIMDEKLSINNFICSYPLYRLK